MSVSLEVLKYILFLQQRKFSLFASLWQTDFKLEKLVTFFPEILTHVTVGLIEKIVLFTEKMLVYDLNLLYLKAKGIY